MLVRLVIPAHNNPEELWINPAHIIKVISYQGVNCNVYMIDGMSYFQNMTPEQFQYWLSREMYLTQKKIEKDLDGLIDLIEKAKSITEDEVNRVDVYKELTTP